MEKIITIGIGGAGAEAFFFIGNSLRFFFVSVLLPILGEGSFCDNFKISVFSS